MIMERSRPTVLKRKNISDHDSDVDVDHHVEKRPFLDVSADMDRNVYDTLQKHADCNMSMKLKYMERLDPVTSYSESDNDDNDSGLNGDVSNVSEEADSVTTFSSGVNHSERHRDKCLNSDVDNDVESDAEFVDCDNKSSKSKSNHSSKSDVRHAEEERARTTSFSVLDILDPNKFVGCGAGRTWSPWGAGAVRDYSKTSLDRLTDSPDHGTSQLVQTNT